MPPVGWGVGWLESRDDTRWMPQNNFSRSRDDFFQPATGRTKQMFFNELRFSAAKSIRTSTIILASFNIVAALATAIGILCEAYFRERRNNKWFKFRRHGFTFVSEGEAYPLVLSIGILMQSSTFVGAQSTGLDSLFGLGCTTMAQLMLPAVFIAPYIQLVFAVEMAIRALQRRPFAPRGKYNVTICLAIVGMLILANFLIAAFDRSPDFCLTSLFWFVAHYSALCFGLFVAIAAIVLTCTVVIFVRLHRSTKVEVTARVSASRMVYYLALAVISDGFIIPFFFVQAFRDRRGQNSNALTLALVASVVANVSGLMTGGLYLFLKTSTLSTIGPRDKAGGYEERGAKYRITHCEPNECEGNSDSGTRVMHPTAGPRSLRRMESDASLISTEKEEEALDGKIIASSSTTSAGSNEFVSAAAAAPLPRAPEPARIPAASPPGGHIRKQSYSLFPKSTPASKPSLTVLPATTYFPSDTLKPPPSMATLSKIRHRRDSSLVSSETVQIGLRLSSVDDMNPLAKNTAAAFRDSEVHSLGCPNVLSRTKVQAPKRPKGLCPSAATPQPTPAVADESPSRDPVKDARMKTLPPVPGADGQPGKEESPPDETTTLSARVYSPDSPAQAKLPSRNGVVGTGMPVAKPPKAAAPRSPPRRRGTGESVLVTLADVKGEWI